MNEDFPTEPSVSTVFGAGVIATAALLIVIVFGFARPARKTTLGGEVRVGAAALVGGAFATLGRHPRAALGLVAVGAVGSLAADLVGYVTSLSVTNIVWWIVNCVLIFHWHRSVLATEARAVGFDVESASFVAILGRSWLIGLILVLTVLVVAIPAIAVSVAGVSNPAGLAAAGGATGLAVVIATVWTARFVLSFPATSLRQPDPGIWEMHARAKGIGVTITAAIATLLLLFVAAVILSTMLADIAWAAIDPEGWAMSLDDSFREVMLRPTFRPWEFVLFNVPTGILLGLSSVLCVSAVSIAYRRWILPEYEPRPTGDPSPTGDEAPLVRL